MKFFKILFLASFILLTVIAATLNLQTFDSLKIRWLLGLLIWIYDFLIQPDWILVYLNQINKLTIPITTDCRIYKTYRKSRMTTQFTFKIYQKKVYFLQKSLNKIIKKESHIIFVLYLCLFLLKFQNAIYNSSLWSHICRIKC